MYFRMRCLSANPAKPQLIVMATFTLNVTAAWLLLKHVLIGQ